jgi:hypothetical protein
MDQTLPTNHGMKHRWNLVALVDFGVADRFLYSPFEAFLHVIEEERFLFGRVMTF